MLPLNCLCRTIPSNSPLFYPLPTSSPFEKGGKGDLIKGDTEKSTPTLSARKSVGQAVTKGGR